MITAIETISVLELLFDHTRSSSDCADDSQYPSMSGKRVLDAVALLHASRAVASHHLSIRLQQLDVYSKTSTLVKAVKSRSDLAPRTIIPSTQRFGSNANPASQKTYGSNADAKSEQIPSTESVQKPHDEDVSNEGLEQDHHYKPEDNSVADDVPRADLDIQQEKAKRHPLPDGTIPLGEAALGKVSTDQEVFHQRPTVEPLKTPLAHHVPSSTSLEPESSHRSSIPSPDSGPAEYSGLSPEDVKIMQRQSESQIPSKAAEPPKQGAAEVRATSSDGGVELGVDQESDSFYRAPDSASPVLSALPRVKLPKNTGNVQGGDSHIKENVNSDIFYSSGVRHESPAASEEQDAPESGEPSEEMVNQIFHSPRVSRILGSKGKFGTLQPKHTSFRSSGQIDPVESQKRTISLTRVRQAKATTTSGNEDFTPAPWAKKEQGNIATSAGDTAKDGTSSRHVSHGLDLLSIEMLIN